MVLLRFGVIPDAIDNQGSTALHVAAYNSHDKIIQFFIELGTDISLLTHGGNSALDLARIRHDKPTIRCLLAAVARSVFDDALQPRNREEENPQEHEEQDAIEAHASFTLSDVLDLRQEVGNLWEALKLREDEVEA
jgi:ankyrin repeat protein